MAVIVYVITTHFCIIRMCVIDYGFRTYSGFLVKNRTKLGLIKGNKVSKRSMERAILDFSLRDQIGYEEIHRRTIIG